jgi:lactate dehydrogenase-like 2-hydroxyacid dehydrogenase
VAVSEGADYASGMRDFTEGLENMQADGLGDVPSSMQYLMRSSRTVLTPHVAGWTVESKYKLAAVLADKIIEVLK